MLLWMPGQEVLRRQIGNPFRILNDNSGNAFPKRLFDIRMPVSMFPL
jgi:hypothetical protein